MHTKRNLYGAAKFASIPTPGWLPLRGPISPPADLQVLGLTHILSEQSLALTGVLSSPVRQGGPLQSKLVICPVWNSLPQRELEFS